MELTNEFTVSVPVETAWTVLTDVERIAPCMPGAQLQEIEGDEYRGVVKVKVGPITAQYKGAATFVEKDEAAHKAVLKAEGRDTRGQGNASAMITAQLQADGDGTKVTVTTDLTVTGKVAQFGRGVLVDVSTKLLTQFVDCLHDDVLANATGAPAPASSSESSPEPAAESGVAPVPAGTTAGAAAGTGSATTTTTEAPPVQTNGSSATSAAGVDSGIRRLDHPEKAPVDLLGTAGAPVAKRVLPVIGTLVVILWLLRRRRRK